MGNWNDIHDEIVDEEVKRNLQQRAESTLDRVRRKYLKQLSDRTGRNVIAYYSGWLNRSGPEFGPLTMIGDDDKNGFMSCFKDCDWSKGLDLVLHLPGGSIAATETIIDYLRSKFEDNIRTIVPQISMSGGTMIACAGREIIMGTHSNLGPIDPQFGSWPAIAIVKEFERAIQECTTEPNKALIWQPIIAQYQPTLLSQAQHAIAWSREIGKKALVEGMLKGDPDGQANAEKIVDFLLSHDLHRAHGRHLHRKELKDVGLKIVELEADQALQDAVLSVHHAMTHTLMNSNAVKIIESDRGIALIRNIRLPTPAQAGVNGPPAVPRPAPPPQAPPPPPAAPATPQIPAKLPGFLRRLVMAVRFVFHG